MSFKSNYIKDIETFFLERSGNGVMLSSRDYDLIQKWKDQGIPKGIVFWGISDAIEADSLYRESMHISGSQTTTNESMVIGEHLKAIINKIDTVLVNEKRDWLINIYHDFRNRITQLLSKKTGDIFREISDLEYQFFDICFIQLDNQERKDLVEEAESMIPKNARFINKNDKDDTIIAFRNELLEKKHSIVNIFEYD